MTTGDQQVERLADKLQALADRSAAEGGAKAKLAQPLADDAAFLRKLKPSLIKARAKGEAAQPPVRDSGPGEGVRGNREVSPTTALGAPSGPQLGKRQSPKAKKRSGGGGPNPWLVMGVCLAAGVVLAKWIDWRGHAHPRD
jgi:hypothetical protein